MHHTHMCDCVCAAAAGTLGLTEPAGAAAGPSERATDSPSESSAVDSALAPTAEIRQRTFYQEQRPLVLSLPFGVRGRAPPGRQDTGLVNEFVPFQSVFAAAVRRNRRRRRRSSTPPSSSDATEGAAALHSLAPFSRRRGTEDRPDTPSTDNAV